MCGRSRRHFLTSEQRLSGFRRSSRHYLAAPLICRGIEAPPVRRQVCSGGRQREGESMGAIAHAAHMRAALQRGRVCPRSNACDVPPSRGGRSRERGGTAMTARACKTDRWPVSAPQRDPTEARTRLGARIRSGWPADTGLLALASANGRISSAAGDIGMHAQGGTTCDS